MLHILQSALKIFCYALQGKLSAQNKRLCHLIARMHETVLADAHKNDLSHRIIQRIASFRAFIYLQEDAKLIVWMLCDPQAHVKCC